MVYQQLVWQKPFAQDTFLWTTWVRRLLHLWGVLKSVFLFFIYIYIFYLSPSSKIQLMVYQSMLVILIWNLIFPHNLDIMSIGLQTLLRSLFKISFFPHQKIFSYVTLVLCPLWNKARIKSCNINNHASKCLCIRIF